MLKINEIFGPTIQGEGKSSGEEVLFIRLSGCNLNCVWCDTQYAREENTEMSVKEILQKLEELSHLKRVVISGGEPFLQSGLIFLLQQLKLKNYYVEIETNGTICPPDVTLQLLDQINCSPKLISSGNGNRRINSVALHKLSLSGIANFKFVVSSSEDMTEILSLADRFKMKDVYLMPQGKTREEQLNNSKVVEELANLHGFKFSPRLHVLKWNGRRGV